MRHRLRAGVYSFADFLELVTEDEKADLLHGGIYMASPESLDHNDLETWLGSIFRAFVEERDLGRVFVTKDAFRLSDDSAPEPDLGFIATARLDRLRSGYVDGPPDLAVEIVSPESVDRDYEHKRAIYEEFGVGEYWLLDPDEQTATFLLLESGAFVERKPDGNIYRSRQLPGFWIDVRWLWQRPLPSVRRTADQILTQPR
jgi:Uma2 family endonuclease